VISNLVRTTRVRNKQLSSKSKYWKTK